MFCLTATTVKKAENGEGSFSFKKKTKNFTQTFEKLIFSRKLRVISQNCTH